MSFSNRYLITLSSNIIRAILNFIVSISVARYLMPEAYGNYQYILAILTAVLIFINMGSENAYFTFISQRLQSFRFHLFYFVWQFLQLCMALCLIVLLSDDLYQVLFKDLEKSLILIALVAVYFISNVQNTINHIIESIRMTYYSQIMSIVVALFHLVIILCFIYFDNLTIETIFKILFVEYLFYSIVMFFLMRRFQVFSDDTFDLKLVFKSFYTYTKPLFFLSLGVFISTFIDRWLIQTYIGGEGQAFFSISIQFSALIILVTSSVLKIFRKEIAESLEEKDLEKTKKYFEVVSKNLFIFTTLVSSILFFFSEEILIYFYTDVYLGASLVFKLMMLYPILQSMGQLYSSFSFASSQTRLYTNISYFTLTLGIVLALYFLSDKGLGMGAEGIAIKLLILGIVSTSLLEYNIINYLKSKYDFLFKLKYIIIIFFVSYLVYYVQHYLGFSFLVQVFIVGVFYILPVGIYLFRNLKKELEL